MCLDQCLKLLLALIFSAIIGFEREKKNKPAGIRTHILVGLGSAVYVLSTATFSKDAQARIIANLITGIGFIGAGAIMKTQNRVVGLTTAASLWLTVAIGALVAQGNYYLAAFATILGYIVLKYVKRR